LFAVVERKAPLISLIGKWKKLQTGMVAMLYNVGVQVVKLPFMN
jgi:hypothetical protein